MDVFLAPELAYCKEIPDKGLDPLIIYPPDPLTRINKIRQASSPALKGVVGRLDHYSSPTASKGALSQEDLS